MPDEMKTEFIRAFDLPDVWFRAVKACMDKGYNRPVFRGSRKEQRRMELDHVVLEIAKPSMRPLVPDVPEGVPPPVDMRYVNRYVGYIITADKTADEQYTYGERVAGEINVEVSPEMEHIDKIEGERISSFSFNQLEKISEFLGETPETNRCIIEVGKAEDLLLKHPPCLRLMHFKVRYGQLHLYVYFRSWDAWAGLPGNLAAFQLLKEYLARQFKVDDGKIFASSLGLHVYSGQWKYAKLL